MSTWIVEMHERLRNRRTRRVEVIVPDASSEAEAIEQARNYLDTRTLCDEASAVQLVRPILR